MSQLVNDIVTRLYLNGDWRDVSSDVRAANGITIQRGSGSEDETTPPQSCDLTLDNTSGDYTERDPTGQWFGYLGRNTPLEQSLRLAVDTASVAVTGGWGTTEADSAGALSTLTWVVTGGSVSDYAKAAGKATHSVTSTNVRRLSYLSTFSQRDVDFRVTWSVNVSDITGASITTDVVLRGVSLGSTQVAARMTITTAEAVQVDFVDGAGTSLTGAPVTVSGITHTSSQALKIRAQSEGQTFRVKVWVATAGEPLAWSYVWNSPSDTDALRLTAYVAGWVGIGSQRTTSNSNGTVTFSYDSIEIQSPQFYGEVSEWPQTRDVSGNDKTVSIEAAGLTRRLSQGVTPLQSALRRYLGQIPTGNTLPDHYWPLEDELRAVAEEVLAVRGNTSLSFELDSLSSGTINWAADKRLSGSVQSPELRDGGRLQANVDPSGKTTDWTVFWVMKTGIETGAQVLFYTTSSVFQFTLVFYTDGLIEGYLTETDPLSPTLIFSYTIPAGDYDDTWHDYVLRVRQNGGNVEFFLYVSNVLVASGFDAATMAGLNRILFAAPAGTTEPIAVGHVAVWATAPLPAYMHSATTGYSGDIVSTRLARLCLEEDVDLQFIGETEETQDMGAQRVDSLLNLLRDAATVDLGYLYESKCADTLVYRTLRSLYSRSSWATLSLADKQLSPPWTPVSDDRYLRNKVVAQRIDGGNYTYSLSTGKLSTLAPGAGGVGVYDDLADLNVMSDVQLPDQAAWRVHLGTIDEERYPRVVVELARNDIRVADPTLYAQLLDLDVGDQITLADLDATGVYDDTKQVVIGYRKHLTRFTHTLELVCAPASAYDIFTLDSTTQRLDAAASTLNEDLDTTETGVDVVVAPGDFWATTAANSGEFPFDILIGGERMTVTACTGTSSPQTLTVTRSVNGVVKTHSTGAAVHVFQPFVLGL